MKKDVFLLFQALSISALLLSILVAQISYAQQQPQISQKFTSSTTAKQVVDAYKAGIPFKTYIQSAASNNGSPDNTIIKNQLSSGNVACGGSDAISKATICDSIISFAKLACGDSPSISENCSHNYIDEYISQRHLDAQAINKSAYRQLAHVMIDVHPEAQGNDEVFELR
ncbi:MAG: hypothetical protein ACJ72C_08125 [Nitrososphaeraceae archaeon]